MYWQEIDRRDSVKFEANLEDIFNIAGFSTLSMYPHLTPSKQMTTFSK